MRKLPKILAKTTEWTGLHMTTAAATTTTTTTSYKTTNKFINYKIIKLLYSLARLLSSINNKNNIPLVFTFATEKCACAPRKKKTPAKQFKSIFYFYTHISANKHKTGNNNDNHWKRSTQKRICELQSVFVSFCCVWTLWTSFLTVKTHFEQHCVLFKWHFKWRK